MENVVVLQEIQAYYLEHIFNNSFLYLYFITVFVDVLLGNAVALQNKCWNSKTGLNGTLRHLALFTIVILLLPMIAFTTTINVLSDGVLFYIIGQYTISILENMSALGMDLNESFTKYFEFLGNNDEGQGKQDNKKE